MFEINKFMITLMLNFDGMAEHNILGKQGEEVAIKWLQENGFEVIDRNWRYGRNELDVVCMHEGDVVIVEVKSRTTIVNFPEELLPLKKRRSIVRLGAKWLALHNVSAELRFDLLVVEMSSLEVSYYKDAIMVYDV